MPKTCVRFLRSKPKVVGTLVVNVQLLVKIIEMFYVLTYLLIVTIKLPTPISILGKVVKLMLVWYEFSLRQGVGEILFQYINM